MIRHYITPKQLHKWYLEAVNTLNTSDYNVSAEKEYESLTEGQKYIDKYIAKKINNKIAYIIEYYYG